MERMPRVEDVREYYDEFLRSKMLDYRLRGNKRLDAALARVVPLLRPDFRVLDVGCGIGIISEKIAQYVPRGSVLGVDLSPHNIWYAEQTVKAKNLSFAALDVVSEMDSILERMTGPIDLVLLVDVIEHIPESARQRLLEQVRGLSADQSWLVMTYPSPQYQRFLIQNDPDELQIVDNVIELEQLLAEAHQAGYQLSHFSLEDMWRSDQYCHVIFKTESFVGRITDKSEDLTVISKVKRYVTRRFEDMVLLPWRKKKYVDSVFNR